MTQKKEKCTKSLTRLVAIRMSEEEKSMVEYLQENCFVNISKYLRNKIVELYLEKTKEALK